LKAPVGLLLLLAAVGCSTPPEIEPAQHLLLITLDTTRFDRLGCYGKSGAGTPRIDALAASGLRFERAYATSPLTLPSHISILTGLNPPRSGIRMNGDTTLATGAQTLAERLAVEGFYTAAAVGGAPLSSAYPASRGFVSFDDRFTDPRNAEGLERDAGLVVRSALEQLKQRGERRAFIWVHFFDPHAPYEPPSPYRERFADDPYQGEIARVDAAIAELLAGVEATLPRDELLIAVVADHGESLGDHGEPTHGFFIYDPTTRVPMILAGAGGVPQGGVVASPVSTVDLVPTVLDLLGLEAPADLDGQRLDLSGTDLRDEPIYLETELPARQYGWSGLRGAVDGWNKYIDAPRAELYDLKRDPDESFNELQHRPALAGELQLWLDEIGGAEIAPARAPRPDPRLLSLGYVGTGASKQSDRSDPKDRLETYVRFQQAGRALELGHPDEALPLLDALLAQEETPGALFQHAVALRMSGRLDAASADLGRLAELTPEHPGIFLEWTRIAAGREDAPQMLRFASKHLARFPSHAEALMFRGAARELLGDSAAAEQDYVQALTINPAFGAASLRLAALQVRAGRIAEARATLRTHLTFHPNDELASGLLGSI